MLKNQITWIENFKNNTYFTYTWFKILLLNAEIEGYLRHLFVIFYFCENQYFV